MEEKLNKIYEIVFAIQGNVSKVQSDISEIRSDISEMRCSITLMQGEIDDLKVQVSDLNVRMTRVEQRLEMTFEAVGNLHEEVTEIKHRQERYDLILGEIATTLMEHNARFRLSTAG